MEKKSWRIARRNGFTAIEIVVSVVVLAILSAYAAPKLFGVKEQADATEEILKIKDIEARHSQEMLKAGKRGVNPTLGDVVGFRPEVVAEPAPDTAPMLVDWRWASNASWGGTSDIWDVRNWVGKQYDSSGEDFKCSHPQRYINPLYLGEQVAYDSGYKQKRQLLDFRLSRQGDTENAPVSQNAPTCSIDMEYKVFTEDAVYSVFPAPWGSRGWLLHTSLMGYASQRTVRYNNPSSPHSDILSVRLWYQSGTIGPLDRSFADEYRLDCSSYSVRYSVGYQIKGISGFSSNATAGLNKEFGGWLKTPTTADTRLLVGTSPNIYTPIPNLQTHLPTRNYGYCERVGPAPAVPPSHPGDPGAYPMAADGSGYCLSPGRKLPTYRDSSGTPTSSSSDPVVELATEAVDDPTNCPG